MLPFVYLVSFLFKGPLAAYATTVFVLSVVSMVRPVTYISTVNAQISAQGAYFIFLRREGGANSKGGAYLKGGAYFVYQFLASK